VSGIEVNVDVALRGKFVDCIRHAVNVRVLCFLAFWNIEVCGQVRERIWFNNSNDGLGSVLGENSNDWVNVLGFVGIQTLGACGICAKDFSIGRSGGTISIGEIIYDEYSQGGDSCFLLLCLGSIQYSSNVWYPSHGVDPISGRDVGGLSEYGGILGIAFDGIGYFCLEIGIYIETSPDEWVSLGCFAMAFTLLLNLVS